VQLRGCAKRRCEEVLLDVEILKEILQEMFQKMLQKDVVVGSKVVRKNPAIPFFPFIL
jgi:hypothetical protein